MRTLFESLIAAVFLIKRKVFTLVELLRVNVSFQTFRILSAVLSSSGRSHGVWSPNKLFDTRDLDKLKEYTVRMMVSDQRLFVRLSEKRIHGLRAWEYGLLLGLIDAQPRSKTWLTLDVGPGNSAFPAYLASRVRGIVTVDYPSPLERPSAQYFRASYLAGVKLTYGTMLTLPFAKDTFDLITCISTIEHLDDLGTGAQIPYDQFTELTRIGLREFGRVIRPGGYLYLTTDAYLPELQGIDAWSAKRRGGTTLWSAYHFRDIEAVFLKTLNDIGFEIVGESDFNSTSLIDDQARSNYRGRYFTTFCVFARKSPKD